MAIKIEMPKLSDTMTEGTVVRWLKQVGDEVEIGDEIAEIETDKATMAMEAFDEGILSEILVEEGGTAAIGATLAILREEGDETAGEGEGEAEERPETTDMPAPVAAAEEGSGESRSVPAPVPPPTTGADRIKASPLARKMAEASGLDLAALQGTGPGGRVVKKDIEAAMGGAPTLSPADSSALSAPGPAPPEVLPEPAAAAAVSEPAPPEPVAAPLPPAEPERPSAPEPEAPAPAGKDRRIELSNLRRIIAERLLTSKTTIPHFYLHLEADVAPLMDIRHQVNAQAEATHGNKYTVNDFVLKAVINALQAVPAVNAALEGDHIVQFGQIGIAVAVAVEDGLVTPVVKGAAAKSLLQISREVKDLAARAREGKLLPNEFDGGTITVSNLGAYGVESFDAIINPPQAAILSVGAISEKPVVVDGEVVAGLRMDLGLSCDHRVVDGAVGAEFLAQVKKLIEHPALMLV